MNSRKAGQGKTGTGRKMGTGTNFLAEIGASPHFPPGPHLPRLPIFIGLLFLLSSFAHATTVQRLSLDDLVTKANRIVVGKVNHSRTFWSPNGKLILTTYTIDVQEAVKGRSAPQLELTTVGGQ